MRVGREPLRLLQILQTVIVFVLPRKDFSKLQKRVWLIRRVLDRLIARRHGLIEFVLLREVVGQIEMGIRKRRRKFHCFTIRFFRVRRAAFARSSAFPKPTHASG